MIARVAGIVTAQHLRRLERSRRLATLVAFAIEMEAALVMVEKLVGSLFRRVDRTRSERLLGQARLLKDTARAHARLGRLLMDARARGRDPLWNMVYLDRAVQHLRRSDIDVPDELLAHVAPLGCAMSGSPATISRARSTDLASVSGRSAYLDPARTVSAPVRFNGQISPFPARSLIAPVNHQRDTDSNPSLDGARA